MGLFTSLFPNLGKKMQEESREWIYHCNECGADFSVADIGGVRYKAAGNPKRKQKCIKCGQTSWMTLSKRK